LAACSATVPHAQTFKRGQRIYRVGEENPFTGVVVGKGREAYHKRRMAYEKTYVDGLLNGITKYWYGNGQPESVIPYKNGKIDGIVMRYYPDGKRRSKIHYVGGLRGGDKGEVFWSPNGKIRRG
jgi:antitoxin component YwqK of YwqJK toxin-antitoxin module